MRRHDHRSIHIAVFVVFLMFSFSFAMAPLYRVLCKKNGFNGSVNFVENSRPVNVKIDRSIQVQFVATNNANLPWEFHPNTNGLDVHPKDMATVTFFAKNNSDHVMTVQAIPSFTPANAAQYFHKVECFCFTQQTLQPGEEKNMAVVFRLDPEMPEDIRTITLSYTLFDVPTANQTAEVSKKKQLAKATKKKQIEDDDDDDDNEESD